MKIQTQEAYLNWLEKTQFRDTSLIQRLRRETRIEDELKRKLPSTIATLKLAWKKDRIDEGDKCAKCNSDKDLTLDHIIPVLIIEQFGIDESRVFMPDNYQILCTKCNVFKSSRLDFSNPKTKQLLLELINEV